jgi:hypothetical protein
MATNPTAYHAPAARSRRTPPADTAIDPYLMANLASRTTGLPLTVWVSQRGHASHDARIKVSLTHGKMDIDNLVSVGIRPEPWRVTEGLGNADFEQIARWIKLNESVLLEYWNEIIDTGELISRLKKV